MPAMDLGPTLGAMLFGIMVTAILYGAMCMQMINYLSKFVCHDRWTIVATACVLWLLDTFHVCIGANYLYHNLVMNNCKPPLITTKVDDLSTFVISLVTFIVHSFYTQRIWILSRKNRWLTGAIGVLAIIHFGCELAAVAFTYKYPRYDQLHRGKGYFTAALSLAAILDLLIAGTFVYLLNLNKTGFKSTETLLNRIAVYAISSGALTSITDTIILICYLKMPNNLVYLAIYASICELYTIALLTSLNARESMRNIHTNVSNASGSL